MTIWPLIHPYCSVTMTLADLESRTWCSLFLFHVLRVDVAGLRHGLLGVQPTGFDQLWEVENKGNAEKMPHIKEFTEQMMILLVASL